MSEGKDEDTNTMMFCANCGTAGNDDIKLKKCTACYLVRYCGVKCQKEHRKQHKKECKKRAAELHDEILFKEPESSCFGDCPICCVPLSIDLEQSSFMSCCSKFICNGCHYVNQTRELEGRLEHKCPFCRTALPPTDEEFNRQLTKRIEVNDPVALRYMGWKKNNERDYKGAFEYYTKAAALGDVNAHYQISCLYRDGLGVEKDGKKQLHHVEQAAIGGHPRARHNLGCMEERNGKTDRAVKHWIIGANLGHEMSLECVKALYKDGFVSKENLAATLRSHKATIDATKSPQREAAAAFVNWQKECRSRAI